MDLASIKKQLKEKGYKITGARLAIIETLMMGENWVTARDLHQKLALNCYNIDFSTVCRNLDTLSAMGIICRVDRDNNGIFAYNVPETEQHHHHLICRSCGKISPVEYCPLSHMKPWQSQGFGELECRFEIYGTCHDCQPKT